MATPPKSTSYAERWRALRAASIDIFKRAVTTRAARNGAKQEKLREEARVQFTTLVNSAKPADLPFIDELREFSVHPEPYSRYGNLAVPYITPASYKKDTTCFNRWCRMRGFSHPKLSAKEQDVEKLIDTITERQMDDVITALTNAKRASLRAFCKSELIALQNAYDACVERMKLWDDSDVDVEKICNNSPLYQ